MPYARTTERGAQRLLILANFLDQLPIGSMYMGAWLTDAKDLEARAAEDPFFDMFQISDERLEALGGVDEGSTMNLTRNAIDCGFAACAVGWACSIPEFQEAGLKLVRDDDSAYPVYEDNHSFDAVYRFFDVDWTTSNALFGASAYGQGDQVVNPSEVATRIRGYAMFGHIDGEGLDD